LADRRRLLLGLGAAAAVALLAGSAYALTHGDHRETSHGPNLTASCTPPTAQVSANRVVSKDAILVPIVEEGTKDPALHEISAQCGTDLGPVPGLRPGSQSFASQSHDGARIVYRWGPPDSGWPKEFGTLWVTNGQQSGRFLRENPKGLLCWTRLGWGRDDSQVVLACQQDENGDGPDDSSQTAVYTAILGPDGRIDPADLHRQFGVERSPDSLIDSVGYTFDGGIMADFVRGENPGVYVAEQDGVPQRLTSQDDHDAAPSPTSDLIAFTRDGDLYVASLDSSKPPCPMQRVRSNDDGIELCDLTPSNGFVRDPSWSWNGEAIAYCVENPDTGMGTLHLIALNAGSEVRLTDPQLIGAPAWAPR
jgi:hypothetical protein